MAPRVLVCDELSPAALEIFRARGLESEVRLGLSEDELVAAVPGVEALVVRSATKITRRVIEAATDLRVVGRAGVGVDNVDTETATERGVVVMNTPTGNTTSAAELTVALLLALARHLPRADRVVRSGTWSKKGLTGTEVAGKRLGIIGLGRIGRAVAKRALGLEMTVVATDPFLQGNAPPVAGIDVVDLDTLLATSDFVTLHLPLADATKNLLSRERLAAMKKGARLVNAARGGLVDEAALVDALESGHLAGAAFDVFAEEPPPKTHPLFARDDVVLTPHLGASSEEAQHAVAVDIARQIADFLLDGVAHNAVNAPAVSAQTLREIAPYVLLAEKIGSLLAQLASGPIRKIELTVSGEIARVDHRHVSLALLCGILKAGIDEDANFVSAPVIARERGIRVLESSEEDAHSWQSLVKVRASTRGGEDTHVVAGAVFGREPRIVRIDDLHVDLEPRGPILITLHADVPGVVGMLGTVLGQEKVNIRRIELGPASQGRDGGGRTARGFLTLDEMPAPAVVAKIAALPPMKTVKLVRL
ncbi:MAG TPA: phosphoglycerate dehydrogenase [Planctomycetota bacterium]|jgi:D-3-phosphoglycerate dehydrogenase|nr:phosphoglycerate dehydrogenase [Planctomycetota bacterium]